MGKKASQSFTIVELLVVITTITILALIAYPSYTSVQARAKATVDMNNLRQIGIATQTYMNDNDQVLPAALTWPGTTATPVLYSKYIGTRKIFQSPFDKRSPSETDTAPVSYGINTNMYAASPGINRNMTSVVSSASTILMAPNYTGDPTQSSSWTGTATNAPNLPVGGAGTSGPQGNGKQINALFCDYHVEAMQFGPSTVVGSFKDTTSNPLGQKHWDPTK